MPWETSDNRPTERDIVIVDALFTKDDRYTNSMGEQPPVLAIYEDTGSGKQRSTYLSLGTGWQIADGGTRIESSVRDAVHSSSNLGRWIDCMVEIVPQDVLDNLGEPTEADTWVGLKLHIEEESYEMEDEKKTRPIPTEFLGADDTEPEPKSELEAETESGSSDSPFADNETTGNAERMDAEPEPEPEPETDGELSRRDNIHLGRWAGKCDSFAEFDELFMQNYDDLTEEAQDALMDQNFAREIWERLS